MFPVHVIPLVSSLVTKKENLKKLTQDLQRSAIECLAFVWMPKHLLISAGAIPKGSDLCTSLKNDFICGEA